MVGDFPDLSGLFPVVGRGTVCLSILPTDRHDHVYTNHYHDAYHHIDSNHHRDTYHHPHTGCIGYTDYHTNALPASSNSSPFQKPGYPQPGCSL